LLVFDFGITTLGALLDALAVDVERCTFSRENRVLDPEALLEVCTCLITIMPRDDAQGDKDYFEVQLAHYTVKEYLISDRIGRGSAATFQISRESAYSFTAKCFIIYMLDEDYQALPEPQWSDSSDRIGLMNIAMCRWAEIVQGVKLCVALTAITPLILKLLDATDTYFQTWVETSEEIGPTGRIIKWTVAPGGESCLTLAYLCYYDLFETAQYFVENLLKPVVFETEIKLIISPRIWAGRSLGRADDIEDGKLLYIAALMKRVSFVKYFIAKGANINAISAKGLSVLGSAVGRGWYSVSRPQSMLGMVELLLQNGADPNISGVLFTPLQRLMSAWSKDLDTSVTATIATSLLDFGADVNGVGNEEINVARLLSTIEDFCLQTGEDEQLDFGVEDIETEPYTMWNYNSPLRIVDHYMGMTYKLLKGDLYRLTKMKEFLISRGAKSLHHSPKHKLPGHLDPQIIEYLWSIGFDVPSPTSDDDSGSVVDLEAEARTVSRDSMVDTDEQGDKFIDFEAASHFPLTNTPDNSIYILENPVYTTENLVSGQLLITGSVTLPRSTNLQQDSTGCLTLGLAVSIKLPPSENFVQK
jgi:hypothetical protein